MQPQSGSRACLPKRTAASPHPRATERIGPHRLDPMRSQLSDMNAWLSREKLWECATCATPSGHPGAATQATASNSSMQGIGTKMGTANLIGLNATRKSLAYGSADRCHRGQLRRGAYLRTAR